jgi:hypothetical protein
MGWDARTDDTESDMWGEQNRHWFEIYNEKQFICSCVYPTKKKEETEKLW